MRTTDSTIGTRVRVGIFTLGGLLLIGAVTVMVNDRPFWWRRCELVRIKVEDATGLKSKSPVRSLGIEIGYLRTVELTETRVLLGICITAPVEVLPSTRAFIRADGFLGDRFVELKPVRYQDSDVEATVPEEAVPAATEEAAPAAAEKSAHPPSAPAGSGHGDLFLRSLGRSVGRLVQVLLGGREAHAAPATGRQIPVAEEGKDVQRLVGKVDDLVSQVTGLAGNLKESLNPEEMKRALRELNNTLANASKTLSPEGGLNQTAQRTLSKLEDAIEQLRAQLTRINQGQGSVGMILNDPEYANELKAAIKGVNALLGRAGNIRFRVDVGGEQIRAYNDSRGWFRLSIWPQPDRYYTLGVSVDPRGRFSQTLTRTTVGGVTTTTDTVSEERTGLLITLLLGKVFLNRLDLSVGALYGDGAMSTGLWLGPHGHEYRAQLRGDMYFRSGVADGRVTLVLYPLPTLYLRAGMDGFRQVNGNLPYAVGAGVSFDDDDIKLLFAFK